MNSGKIYRRVLNCVEAKKKSRSLVGRPPLSFDAMVVACKRSIKMQSQREVFVNEVIQWTRNATSQELNDTDEAWLELDDFAAAVYDKAEPHPLTLRLLADAISRARRDPNALLLHLGLIASRGGRPVASAKHRLLWGRLLFRLEDEFPSAADAMAAVQDACEHRYSETTLREWRDAYRKWSDLSSGG